MGELVLFYVPCPTREKAEEIALALIEKKLIACANIFPVYSIYRWEGRTNSETEYVMFAKTLPKKAGEAEKEIKVLHPYEIPAIIRMLADVNDPYLNWVAAEVG